MYPFFPHLAGLLIEDLSIADGVIVVRARSQTTRSACPACAQVSSRLHSRDLWKLADLPWSGRLVRLIVQVCRFFCTSASCPRQTFAESLGDLASRFARRTTRLKETLEQLGLADGEESQARV